MLRHTYEGTSKELVILLESTISEINNQKGLTLKERWNIFTIFI